MTRSDRLTIEMSAECSDRLQELAARLDASQESLAQEAIQLYLDMQESQMKEIQAAVGEADSDPRRIPHEAVAAWMRTWGSDEELPRPTP